MPIEDICRLIAQRLLQGTMYHEQFANYYNFLGLLGYKTYHEYHYYEQNDGYRNFITYFINQYDKLIPDFSFESLTSFAIIPSNWYEYKRNDMDNNTRRNAVKSGLEKYVRWETQTKKFFEDMYNQSIQIGEVALALKIKYYIENVDKEIQKAQKEYLEIKATDYDLPTIITKQHYLCKKYNKKLKKMRKEFEH